MKITIMIGETPVTVDVNTVQVEIEGAEADVAEASIVHLLVLAQKLEFLKNYDENINLGQLEYLLGTLPDSIYWDTVKCAQCKTDIEFAEDGDDVLDWTFYEKNGSWVCPECTEKVDDDEDDDDEDDDDEEEESKITGVVAEAAEKMEILDEDDEDVDSCTSCGGVISVGDTICPNCNRVFDDEEEE